MSAPNDDAGTDEDAPSRQQLDGRLDKLESWKEHVYDGLHRPEVEELEERVDELENLVNEQAATIQSLTEQLETLSGLSDGQESSPELRNRDTYQSMIDRLVAKDREKLALTYREIEDVLADKGHGKVWPAQLYDVIEDLAELQGFSEGTRMYNSEEQKAIRVNRSKLPFDPAVNEINNDWGAVKARNEQDSASAD